MKRYAVLFLILFAAACYAYTLPSVDDRDPIMKKGGINSITSQEPWRLVRTVSEDDVALTKITKAWGGVGTELKMLPSLDTCTFSFLAYGNNGFAGGPDNGSFSYEIYCCRQFGSLEFVCSGDVTIGAIQASVLPWEKTETATSNADIFKWAEGGASLVSTQDWDLTVGYTETADQMGKISFDSLGCSYVYVRIFDKVNITLVYVLATGR